MHTIPLPQQPIVTSLGEYHGKFEITGCYPGYGTTVGNALRRVLLSSLEGAAVKAVKIKGASHEFSTLPGVMEDIVQLILNIKKVRFSMVEDETVRLTLKVKGEREVTAGDIKTVSGITVVNPTQLIASLTDKKAELEMEIEVGKGLGYVPVEQQERPEKEIGMIAVDAIYTPIRRVNYEIENVRVGKRTDFDKITLEVVTDGSLTPEAAFQRATEILVEQFSSLLSAPTTALSSARFVGSTAAERRAATSDALAPLSARVRKSIREAGVLTLDALAEKTEAEVMAWSGMGAKSVEEIKTVLAAQGLNLQ